MKAIRKEQRGFALLVVFLMAAAMAFALYQELPRAAFESARDKEQLLIDRGNQYKRAIELYYTVNKRYPAELKDLENTNQKRFLRRRYKDPMNGQDEWRLIHTNGVALTDSLVQKPPAQTAANGAPSNGVVPGGGPLGANNLNTAAATDDPAAPVVIDPNTGLQVAAPTQNAAALRRPSDRGFSSGQVPIAGQPAFNPFTNGAFAGNGIGPVGVDPNDPRTWPSITVAPPPGQPGQPPGVQVIPGQAPNPGFPVSQFPGAAQSGIPGQSPGLGGANPQPTFDPNNPAGLPNNSPVNQINANPGGSFNLLLSQPPITPAPAVNPAPGFPPAQQPQPNFNPPNFNPPGVNQPGFNQPGFNQPGFNQTPGAPIPGGVPPQGGGGAVNPATNFINNQLFSPTGTAGTIAGAAANSGSAGAGIAGVASKFKGPSIKSYKKRSKYQEWEFVFEPTAQANGNPATAGNANGANSNGVPNGAGVNPNGAANPAGANSLGLIPFSSGAPSGAPGLPQ